MRQYLFQSLFLGLLLWSSCSNGQSDQELSAQAFAKKISHTQNATLLDVRSPQEFTNGHIPEAQNMDWNSPNFTTQIANLNKKDTVFVYCLSGGRSHSAAQKMRQEGFEQVYELQGGLMQWRAKHLAETPSTGHQAQGMSIDQYKALLQTDQLVLVDFYAEWCGPCKKIKPYLDEIAATNKDRIKVVRINADDQEELCKQLHIEAIPALKLYRGQSLVWEHVGYISKEELLEKVK